MNATAELWDVGLSEYHADRTADSHSSMELFRDSPAKYHAIRNGLIPAPEPTLQMRIGTAVHCLLLCPDKMAEEVEVSCHSPNSNAFKEEKEANPGKTMLTFDQLAMASSIANSVRDHPLAFDLLFGGEGETERAIRWGENSLPLKVRFDRVIPRARYVIDIKTAANPLPGAWARAAYNLGYFRAAAHYLDGFEAYYGEPGEMLYVCVRNEPPYEVFVNELDEEAIRLGRLENSETREKLAWHKRSGKWTAPESDIINKVSLPRYAFYR